MQEKACIIEVEVPEKETDDILHIDTDNMSYEAGEDEFDASDDDHCSDIDEK